MREVKRRLEFMLEKDSDTLASLVQDAKDHHMSDQLGKMAGIRLADYYKLCARLGTYSIEGIVAALEMFSSKIIVSGASVDAPLAGADTELVEQEEPYVDPAASLQENLDEAADIWGSM